MPVQLLILALLIVPSVAQSKIPGDKIKIGVLQDLPEPYASAAGNGGIVAAQFAASDVEKEYLEGMRRSCLVPLRVASVPS